MKKRILGVLLMLLLMISMGLTASAATKETYFEEEGVRYCWVRGSSTEKPTQKIQGYTWIEVREGNRHVTRIGACEEHGIVDHDCGDIWDRYDRLEYKWQLVVKELLVISCRDQAGYSMEGSAFMLLKENIERDANGNPVIYTDANGEEFVKRIGEGNDVVISKAFVGADGYAKIRLEKEGEYDTRLDWEKDFQQLILVQNLNPDPNIPIEESPMLKEYMSLGKRWYVNLLRNGDGEYEVYSITEAPPNKTDNYKELKAYHFDELAEGFVDEYDTRNQIMYLRNAFRVGKLIVNINVVGFQGEIPAAARPYVDIEGPHDYSKRVRKTSTLEDMRMGDYTIECSEPVNVIGYTEKAPELEVKLTYPVSGETKKLPGDTRKLTLDRDQANAVITATYTYYPNHVHTWDEGVKTEPTCTEQGYTTYTCTGYDYDGNPCGETKTTDYKEAFGHEYESSVTPPTCTHAGYTKYTCISCDYSYIEEGDPPLGHAYHVVEETELTCVQNAVVIEECERLCKEPNARRETVKEYATGHKTKPEVLKVIEATCTAPGYDVHECTECDELVMTERKDLPPIGHIYDKGVVTEPTCTKEGYTTYTCTVKDCGYSYEGNRKDALGHKYTSEIVEPTKDREGYTIYTCSICQDSYTDNVKDKLSTEENSDSSSKDKSDKESDNKSDKNSTGSGSSTGGGSQSAGKGNSSNISGTASDTLVVKFYDDQGQPLNSGMVALFEGNTQLKSWSCTYDNVVVVDNLEKYAKDGQVASYTLKQSKAMDGYETSKDSFTVQLQKQDSNLKISVKKNGNIFTGSSKKSAVENGRDGKPIVTIYNTKETTRFELACRVSVEFEGDTQVDEALIAEYQKQQYKFTLNWTTAEGEEKSETLKLVNGVSDSWRAKIPFGTAYTITATDHDGNMLTGLSENASGTLTAKQMDTKVKVEADIKYRIQDASPKKLEMNVIDPKGETPLRGANFELKGPDGEKIATFISRENGKFYMEDVFTELGDYLLTQTKASEGYEALNGGIPIKVSLAYEPKGENNVQILQQTKAVEFAHQAVSENEDGSYTIENDTYEVSLEKSGGNGKKTGVIIGIGGGALVLGAGGAAAYVMMKKKRRKLSAEAVEDIENAEDTEV